MSEQLNTSALSESDLFEQGSAVWRLSGNLTCPVYVQFIAPWGSGTSTVIGIFVADGLYWVGSSTCCSTHALEGFAEAWARCLKFIRDNGLTGRPMA